MLIILLEEKIKLLAILINTLVKKDNKRDIKIKKPLKINNTINVNRLVKVILLLKFSRKVLEL